MAESLTLTAVFTPDENGWTMAQLAEWPAVVTCAATLDEARDIWSTRRTKWSRPTVSKAANLRSEAAASSRLRSAWRLEAPRPRAAPRRSRLRSAA